MLAASLALTAWTRSGWGLAIGLGVAGAASGSAGGAAQALLLSANRDQADRVLVRWSLWSAVGDVLTPILTASAIGLGYTYRGAMAVLAGVALAQGAASAALLPRGSYPAESREDSGPTAEPLVSALGRALRRPRLWGWLFAASSCTLLDELVLALAALRWSHDAHADAAAAAALAVAFSSGSIAGAAWTDSLVAKHGSTRVLVASAVFCAVALAAFLLTTGFVSGAGALFALGVTAAPHHPLALSRAYDELPDRPGTVQAVGQLFVAIEVLAPIVLGLVADRRGLGVALGCLVVQPAVILAVASLVRPPKTDPDVR